MLRESSNNLWFWPRRTDPDHRDGQLDQRPLHRVHWHRKSSATKQQQQIDRCPGSIASKRSSNRLSGLSACIPVNRDQARSLSDGVRLDPCTPALFVSLCLYLEQKSIPLFLNFSAAALLFDVVHVVCESLRGLREAVASLEVEVTFVEAEVRVRVIVTDMSAVVVLHDGGGTGKLCSFVFIYVFFMYGRSRQKFVADDFSHRSRRRSSRRHRKWEQIRKRMFSFCCILSFPGCEHQVKIGGERQKREIVMLWESLNLAGSKFNPWYCLCVLFYGSSCSEMAVWNGLYYYYYYYCLGTCHQMLSVFHLITAILLANKVRSEAARSLVLSTLLVSGILKAVF